MTCWQDSMSVHAHTALSLKKAGCVGAICKATLASFYPFSDSPAEFACCIAEWLAGTRY